MVGIFRRNSLPARLLVSCVLAVLATAQPLALKPASETRNDAFPHADLRIDVPLVMVPVHVTDQLGSSILNLKQANFRIFEDKIEQKIVRLVREDAPASIGLLFDLSASMKDKMAKASDAAIHILKTANPEDEFFLVEFNDRPKLVVPFTNDAGEIQNALARAKPRGQTALFDAINLGVIQMKSARYVRKALIIVSDGGDNHSRHNEAQTKEAMFEAGVQVFAMGIFDQDQKSKSREERDGPRVLTDLAAKTGGHHFPVRDLNELPEVCERIADELRNQYLLGYFSTNPQRDGKFRHVRVVVDPEPGSPLVRVRNRAGYYAPVE